MRLSPRGRTMLFNGIASPHVDRPCRSLAERGATSLLRENPRDETLPFADPLDFDRDRLYCLIELRESFDDVVRYGAHRCGAAAPDASRVGDGERHDGDEEKYAAEHKEFLGRSFGVIRRRIDDGAGDRGRAGDLRVRAGDRLVERIDATGHRHEALLEARLLSLREIGALVLQLPGDLATIVLKLLKLVAEHFPLVHETAVDRVGTREVLASYDDSSGDIGRRRWRWNGLTRHQ